MYDLIGQLRRFGSHKLLAYLLVVHTCLLFTTATAFTANNAAAPVIQRGEIRIEGVVLSVNSRSRTLVLEARKATAYAARTIILDPARKKIITLGNLKAVTTDKGAAGKRGVAGLKPGQAISVIGKNHGVGKPLPARLIVVQTPAAPAPKPVIRNPVASAAPDPVQHIRITQGALRHITDRHTPGGSMTAGKSVFNAGEDISALVRLSESTTPVAQRGGNYARVVDAGRLIGTDRATRRQTRTFTVITTSSDQLVTAFPGLP